MKLSQNQQKLLITILSTLIIAIVISIVTDITIKPSRFLESLFSQDVTVPVAQRQLEYYLEQVAPKDGYTVPITWGDTGIKIVENGGIDIEKYTDNYSDPEMREYLSYLTQSKDKGITIDSQNSYFWVNTLWALGLTQKSDVLDNGIITKEYKDDIGNFASTGGWTLGSQDAVSLYSSSAIVSLTPEQQALVTEVASNIYRPCCSNPTSFPDCNHGMAILGLLELMASQDLTEEQMYEAALAFNSYWFANTYADLAFYFETEKNTQWEDVDPKEVLAAGYSSSSGYQNIKSQIGTIPGSPVQGGSCGA